MRITFHPLRGPAATAAVRKSPALDPRAPIHLRLLETSDIGFVNGFRAPAAAQCSWIPHYKRREAEGREFYFVIVTDGRDRGLVRIHDFTDIAGESSFAWGNWVARPPHSPGLLRATAQMVYGLGFETLGFARAHLAVPKANTGMAAFQIENGAELEHDDGEHLYFRVGPAAYHRLRTQEPEQALERALS